MRTVGHSATAPGFLRSIILYALQEDNLDYVRHVLPCLRKFGWRDPLTETSVLSLASPNAVKWMQEYDACLFSSPSLSQITTHALCNRHGRDILHLFLPKDGSPIHMDTNESQYVLNAGQELLTHDPRVARNVLWFLKTYSNRIAGPTCAWVNEELCGSLFRRACRVGCVPEMEAAIRLCKRICTPTKGLDASLMFSFVDQYKTDRAEEQALAWLRSHEGCISWKGVDKLECARTVSAWGRVRSVSFLLKSWLKERERNEVHVYDAVSTIYIRAWMNRQHKVCFWLCREFPEWHEREGSKKECPTPPRYE